MLVFSREEIAQNKGSFKVFKPDFCIRVFALNRLEKFEVIRKRVTM